MSGWRAGHTSVAFTLDRYGHLTRSPTSAHGIGSWRCLPTPARERWLPWWPCVPGRRSPDARRVGTAGQLYCLQVSATGLLVVPLEGGSRRDTLLLMTTEEHAEASYWQAKLEVTRDLQREVAEGETPPSSASFSLKAAIRAPSPRLTSIGPFTAFDGGSTGTCGSWLRQG